MSAANEDRTMETIQNPKTGRSVNVMVWEIDKADVLNVLTKGGSAKDVSLWLLGQRKAMAEAERTQGGDCASNNFSLRVFETGLDWSLGIATISFMKDAKSRWGRIPRRFKVAASRSGDVFVMVRTTAGEKVIDY